MDGLLLMYFVPSLIAFLRKHKSKWAIAVVDVFLGWTVIGWVWALIWSLTGTE